MPWCPRAVWCGVFILARIAAAAPLAPRGSSKLLLQTEVDWAAVEESAKQPSLGAGSGNNRGFGSYGDGDSHIETYQAGDEARQAKQQRQQKAEQRQMEAAEVVDEFLGSRKAAVVDEAKAAVERAQSDAQMQADKADVLWGAAIAKDESSDATKGKAEPEESSEPEVGGTVDDAKGAGAKADDTAAVDAKASASVDEQESGASDEAAGAIASHAAPAGPAAAAVVGSSPAPAMVPSPAPAMVPSPAPAGWRPRAAGDYSPQFKEAVRQTRASSKALRSVSHELKDAAKMLKDATATQSPEIKDERSPEIFLPPAS